MILGIGSLWGCSRPNAPEFFEQALAKVARDGKPGLVIAIPNDPIRAAALGEELVQCLDRRCWTLVKTSSMFHEPPPLDFELHEILLSSVVLCLDERQISTLVAGAKANETILRISADGSREDGLAVPEEERSTRSGIVAAGERLIFGERNELLAERVRKPFGNFAAKPPEVLLAFTGSGGGSVLGEFTAIFHTVSCAMTWRYSPPTDQREKLESLNTAADILARIGAIADPRDLSPLIQAARQNVPSVVHWRRSSAKPSVRARARALLELAFGAEVEEWGDGMLPFGIRSTDIQTSEGGCSLTPCGMGGMSTRVTRKFLDFAAR